MILEIPGKWFLDTPIWWQNFGNGLSESIYIVKDSDIILKEEYNATKIYGKTPEGIVDLIGLEFETEADATWFLMRWS